MAMLHLGLASLAVILLTSTSSSSEEPNKPNAVLFIVDDLGIGDVGCFGNDTIQTPNIDRIAKDGALLKHHLAADALCTPSRAALLTGRYPIRSGMACENGGIGVLPFVSSAGGLPIEEITMAEVAKKAGYATALFGKWHEGLSCLDRNDFCHHPLNHGFDAFYGSPITNFADFGPEGGGLTGFTNFSLRSKLIYLIRNTSIILFLVSILSVKTGFIGLRKTVFLNALCLLPLLIVLWVFCNVKLLNSIIMRNFEVVEQPIRFENLTQRIVSESISFMEDAVLNSKPFLVVISWFQVHVFLHTSKEFSGRSLHGQYGDNVEEMDWGVGEVLMALERLHQLDETFIYLTSDNGGSTSERGPGSGCHGGYNGIFRGQKGQSMMDGGIRVPAVAMWKNHIKPGTVINVPTSLMDILPTLKESVFQVVSEDNENVIIDGQNIYPLLAGLDRKPPHKLLFHYCCQEITAARYTSQNGIDVYKVYFATPNWIEGTYSCSNDPYCDCDTSLSWHNPPLIYNIGRDPSEKGDPISIHDSVAKETLQEVEQGLKKHKESMIKIGGMRESQMNPIKLIPRPWLQPCCNFPLCKCTDPSYPNLKEY